MRGAAEWIQFVCNELPAGTFAVSRNQGGGSDDSIWDDKTEQLHWPIIAGIKSPFHFIKS
jgi:hypothetical protein